MTFREWLLVEATQYISANDYEYRLGALGWRIRPEGSHRIAYSPDGHGLVGWGVNNWGQHWHLVVRDLLRNAKAKGVGYPDLAFVFKQPFKIPAGFDKATQSVRRATLHTSLYAQQLLMNLHTLPGREINHDGWKTVQLADVSKDGKGLEVLFADGSTAIFPLYSQVEVR